MAQTVAGEISHRLLKPEVVSNGLMIDILDTLKVIRERGLHRGIIENGPIEQKNSLELMSLASARSAPQL